MMNSAVQNLAVSLVALQMARKIPFDDPVILNYVRIGYVSVQAIILATYYWVSLTVNRKNDQTVLKYVELTPPMARLHTTIMPISNTPQVSGTRQARDYDYDLSEVSKLLRSVYMGLATMAVMHGYLKFTQPLFVQALMGLKGLFDAKPVAIHLLGKPATGDLKHPFTTQSIMGVAAGPKTDAASISETEKRVGVKKEE